MPRSPLSRRRLLASTAATTAVVPLSGCQTLLGLARTVLKDPQVQITGMNVRSATLEALDTVFTANVKNPNRISLGLQGLDYSLDVDGRRFADGKTEKALTLPANGSSSLEFPVRFPLGETVQVILETLKKKEVDYVLGTVFRFGAQGFSAAVPVEFPGKAPVPQPPIVGVRDLRVVGIGPTSVGLRLSTWVQNPNIFDVPMEKLGVSLKLNNRKTLTATPMKKVVLKSKKTRDVDFDFSADFASIGLTILEIAQRPVIDWAVGLDLQSGALKFPFEQKGSLRLVG